MRHQNNDLTIDEAIALLSKTTLPTVVVEGADDMIVYRRFEEQLSNIGVSFFPIGGREKILNVFLRKNEISAKVKILFIADKDTWIHSGIPENYSHHGLLFTSGYSLENDVYLDGELWRLLQPAEDLKFRGELEEFIEWYALALSRHLQDPTKLISLHPDHVLNPGQRAGLLQLDLNEVYPDALRRELLARYSEILRGKSLIALLLRHLNYARRPVRHNDKALFESVAVKPGALLNNLRDKVEAFMAA